VVDLLNTYSQEFYARSTVAVARDLVGAVLCRRTPDGGILSAPIIEVEAYTHDDPASHAFRGKTERNAVMFGPPGHAYVYFIYGMYFCLNVVTEPAGTPGAVLIRALDYEGCNGPGRLCRQWSINRSHNGVNLLKPEGELWICRADKLSPKKLGISERIGITQPEAIHLPWRFFVKDHPLVSARNNGRRKVKA